MRKKKLTILGAAAILGLDPSTFHRKLATNCAALTLDQAEKLAAVLELSPDHAQRIFFRQDSKPDQENIEANRGDKDEIGRG